MQKIKKEYQKLEKLEMNKEKQQNKHKDNV